MVLTDSGDRLLARFGTIAYLVGVVLWIVGDSIDLAGGTPVFLERDYVVLACLAIAAFGAAILRTRVLPRWVGGLAVVWAVVWTILYPPALPKPHSVQTLSPLYSVWSSSSTALLLDAGRRPLGDA